MPGLLPAAPVALGPEAWWLPGFALGRAPALLDAIAGVLAQAPLRQMQTPGGRRIGVAMSNCGALGWTSGRDGYRYTACDPLSGKPWPALPALLRALAADAAAAAGLPDPAPDACLINHYLPGTGMGLHQDRDERDLRAAIVSVSLGLPAVFLWGGLRRHDPVQAVPLAHGDVVVWGGADRLRFHGVRRLARAAQAPWPCRWNLTLRRAG